jgi:hypothetical protein
VIVDAVIPGALPVEGAVDDGAPVVDVEDVVGVFDCELQALTTIASARRTPGIADRRTTPSLPRRRCAGPVGVAAGV